MLEHFYEIYPRHGALFADVPATLEALRSIMPAADNRAARIRHGMLTADALVAAGQREGAIATLQQLQAAVPSPRVQQRLDAMKADGSTSGK